MLCRSLRQKQLLAAQLPEGVQGSVYWQTCLLVTPGSSLINFGIEILAQFATLLPRNKLWGFVRFTSKKSQYAVNENAEGTSVSLFLPSSVSQLLGWYATWVFGEMHIF